MTLRQRQRWMGFGREAYIGLVHFHLTRDYNLGAKCNSTVLDFKHAFTLRFKTLHLIEFS
jgi:hypothetical protein